MKFFIDSADVNVIAPLMRSGVFFGVTTNPTILKTEHFSRTDILALGQRLIGLGAQEVFFQSWGRTSDELTRNGVFLFNSEPQIVIKLPCTREGLTAASKLAGEGIKTCVTAVYAAHQALLAAATRARYVAPYLGRMNDAGRDGPALIAQMAAALRQSGTETHILAASIRSVDDVTLLAQSGITHMTFSPKVADLLFEDPLTQAATAQFERDAAELAR